MIISAFLLLVAIFVLGVNGVTHKARIVAALVTFIFCSISVAYYCSDYFTGSGIDESVIYHLEYGLDGAGFDEYIKLILISITFLLASIVVSYLVFHYLLKSRIVKQSIWVVVSYALLLVALFVNPATQDLTNLYLLSISVSSDQEVSALYDEPDIKAISSPLNIVYIYLESLERTYFDETLFPGLVPRLKELEKEGLTFTNIEQLYGTGWTIAGMTASQCGVPLVTPSSGNSMSGVSKFLPGAHCVGDLLKSQGYNLSYIGGSSLSFAGKGKFYETHGFENVQGKETLSEKLKLDGYLNPWGLYDDTLFDYIFEQLKIFSSVGKPFGQFLLTLGTHHPSGHISSSCHARSYLDGSNPILNAVHCSDYLVTEFVKKIQSSDFGNHTLIVIGSDHFAMRNTATHLLDQGDRKNLFIAIHPGNIKARKINKAGSTLDIAPTMLSLMGFEINRLGYGTNLLGEQPTIVESKKKASRFLRSKKGLLSKLWQFPSIDRGIIIDSVRAQARFGGEDVELPVLVEINGDLEIESIYFESNSPEKLTDYVAELAVDKPYIWIDICASMSKNVTSFFLPNRKNDYCVVVGKTNHNNVLNKVNGIKKLNADDILSALQNIKQKKETSNIVLEKLKTVSLDSEDVEFVSIDPSGNSSGDLIIYSSGYGSGQSYMKSIAISERKKGAIEDIERGLTLVAIAGDSVLEKLAHFDFCSPTSPGADHGAIESSFAEIIAAQERSFSAYVIVAHDSAHCGDNFDKTRLFESLPLKRWKAIGFRQPYIGIMAENGKIYETLGEPEGYLTVYLSSFIAPR